MINKEKFNGYLRINGYNADTISHKLGISKASLYNKLNGKTQFVVREITALKDILGLNAEEVYSIFFAE